MRFIALIMLICWVVWNVFEPRHWFGLHTLPLCHWHHVFIWLNDTQACYKDILVCYQVRMINASSTQVPHSEFLFFICTQWRVKVWWPVILRISRPYLSVTAGVLSHLLALCDTQILFMWLHHDCFLYVCMCTFTCMYVYTDTMPKVVLITNNRN